MPRGEPRPNTKAPGTRITAGSRRGRRLKTRSGLRTRPTTALVRQALFNVIGDSIEGARVLDLFSGSGALGIEALSRGAAWVTFVDRDRSCANIVTENLAATGFAQQADVHCADSVDWLKAHPGNLIEYNLLLIDPPYRGTALAAALTTLDGMPLRPDSLVVVEHHRAEKLAPTTHLRPVRENTYGTTRLSFLRYAP